MCYHPPRREVLARLEHETGLTEATTDRDDPSDRSEDPESPADHSPEEPDPETVQRPEPVGFA